MASRRHRLDIPGLRWLVLKPFYELLGRRRRALIIAHFPRAAVHHFRKCRGVRRKHAKAPSPGLDRVLGPPSRGCCQSPPGRIWSGLQWPRPGRSPEATRTWRDRAVLTFAAAGTVSAGGVGLWCRQLTPEARGCSRASAACDHADARQLPPGVCDARRLFWRGSARRRRIHLAAELDLAGAWRTAQDLRRARQRIGKCRHVSSSPPPQR